MQMKFYDNADDSLLKFAVIIAVYHGKWIFYKHKERHTLKHVLLKRISEGTTYTMQKFSF